MSEELQEQQEQMGTGESETVVHDDTAVIIKDDDVQHTADRSSIPTLPQLGVALSLLAGIFAISYIPSVMQNQEAAPAGSVEERVRESLDASNAADAEGDAQEVTLEAASAFVWDVAKQKALFNKNADAQLPLASVTKLMTSLVALETLGGTSKIPMTLQAIRQEGENNFHDGEIFSTESLSDFTLVSSSNDGAYALASASGAFLDPKQHDTEKTFVTAMNIRAEELGLSQTYYTNPTGLDGEDAQNGGYGSARDMAFLVEYLLAQRPEILETTVNARVSVKSDELNHTATNTNEAVDQVAGLIGSKTGYTTLAGGNLIIAFNAGLNRPIIIAILGSTREGRFADALALTTFVKKQLEKQQ